MEKNVGGIDRILRIIVGAVVLVAGIAANSWWALLGAVLVATGLLSRCALYPLVRFKSIRVKTK